ncbi:hypothetical protein pclt_cds_769 [Pandoravirus celtis]|uniref:Uncharacterized protein n=1 Tax=Pandoravirus celtis TaxID=2568002 RepID=A0A4D6EI08_9VIRU|nr:hypothetical protein pclt_cds_769 [Pandoravirus celtis]
MCQRARGLCALSAPAHLYVRLRPRLVVSSLAWTEHDSGHTTATCKRCRSFVVTSYAVDLDILPANDGDPAWTLTHNAVVVTADPGQMPLSLGPSVSGHHQPDGRAQWAEKDRAPADDTKTDDQIKAHVAYAFGRWAQCLPLEVSICATRTERLFSTDSVSGLHHAPHPC